jgi:AhpD family alkylhydroperoxidase
MTPRIEYWRIAPEGTSAFRQMQKYVDHCGIEPALLELVKMRASQINGCAFCLDMHSKDARAKGETEQRLYGLSAWREAPYYSERERAALAWTEAVTQISSGPVSDGLYDEVRRSFNEKEIVDLTLAVIAINGWNRLSIPFRSPTPGSYHAQRGQAAE